MGEKILKLFEMTIEELDLSPRSYNCLKRAGYNTVEQLSKATEDDIIKVRNLGRKASEEVFQKLYSLGIYPKKRTDDEIIVRDDIDMDNNKSTKMYQFQFSSGVIEVAALNKKEAEILAKAEAIKRGWNYGLLKDTVSRLDVLINWANFTEDEDVQFRRLLDKARQGNMYEATDSE